MNEENEFVNVEMVDWECCTCGCLMSMTERFNRQLRSTHERFYCLNGHGQSYTKTEDQRTVDNLETKLASEYAKNAQLEDLLKKANERNAELEKSILQKIKEYFK